MRPEKSRFSASGNEQLRKLLAFLKMLLARPMTVWATVAGTVLLGFQTFILWQQTGLISRQTDALALDQTAHIRDRIVSSSSVEERLAALLANLRSAKTSVEALAEPSGSRGHRSTALCNDTACERTPLFAILTAINADNPTRPLPSVAAALMRLSALLSREDKLHSSVFDEPSEINLDKTKDPIEPVKQLILGAITQCFLDSDKGRRLERLISTLRLLSSSSFAIGFRIGDPDKFKDLTSKFPQTNSNTQMQIIQFESSAGDLISNAGDISPAQLKRTDYPLRAFGNSMANAYAQEIELVADADDACKSTISADLRTLRGLERVPPS